MIIMMIFPRARNNDLKFHHYKNNHLTKSNVVVVEVKRTIQTGQVVISSIRE